MNDLLVHYGCGITAPDSWRNFDRSPTMRLQRLPLVGPHMRLGIHPLYPRNVEYGDIVAGLPIPPASARAVFCSHVLEHLALDDFRTALANTRKYLRPGGLFRLVVPDLRALAQEYLASADPGAALSFMEQTHLGVTARPRGSIERLRGLFGTDQHLWMWDYASLEMELRRAGFRHVRPAAFGDSSEPAFAEVEHPDRWEKAVGIEASP